MGDIDSIRPPFRGMLPKDDFFTLFEEKKYVLECHQNLYSVILELYPTEKGRGSFSSERGINFHKL